MSSRKQIIDAVAKAQGIADPAVERHKDKLFGTPTPKDPTPVDQRDPGPRRVLIEWIGEFGPLAQAKLAAAVQLGLISPAVKAAWETLHVENISTRIPGLVHHTMSVDRDGMSETYTWGPYEYVQSVAFQDVDKLIGSESGHTFRIVGYDKPQPSDATPFDLYIKPAVEKGSMTQETADQIEHIVIDEQPPEALSGVVPGSGKRVGAWTKRG
jgi:hypothetical protein